MKVPGAEGVSHAKGRDRRGEAACDVLVIGAGVAGLRAALDLAALGLEVVVVEQADAPGGYLRQLDRLYPDGRLAAEVLSALLAPVEASLRITLLTRTTVVSSRGSVGAFDVMVQGADLEQPPQELAVGAVVMATGFRPYVPVKGEHGYQRIKAVMTLPEFIATLARTPDGPLQVEGRPVRSVGFLHCVGSRQVEGVHKPAPGRPLQTHCSRVCCTSILHTELDVLRRWPEMRVHSLYQDIRTYGRGHEEIYAEASRAGVVFHRWRETPPEVTRAPADSDSAVRVRLVDQLTADQELELDLDLLVLGTGMMAGETAKLLDVFKLAVSEDGFLQEVHPKLRPVEPAVAGIFLAGASQSPKDVGEACASASAAAVKAAALLGRGEVELAPFVARVDPARCAGTGTCVTACGYEGALRLVPGPEGTRAEVNPALCVGCGACVAVCPSRAIDVAGWTLDQFDAMVDAIVAPVEAS